MHVQYVVEYVFFMYAVSCLHLYQTASSEAVTTKNSLLLSEHRFQVTHLQQRLESVLSPNWIFTAAFSAHGSTNEQWQMIFNEVDFFSGPVTCRDSVQRLTVDATVTLAYLFVVLQGPSAGLRHSCMLVDIGIIVGLSQCFISLQVRLKLH